MDPCINFRSCRPLYYLPLDHTTSVWTLDHVDSVFINFEGLAGLNLSLMVSWTGILLLLLISFIRTECYTAVLPVASASLHLFSVCVPLWLLLSISFHQCVCHCLSLSTIVSLIVHLFSPLCLSLSISFYPLRLSAVSFHHCVYHNHCPSLSTFVSVIIHLLCLLLSFRPLALCLSLSISFHHCVCHCPFLSTIVSVSYTHLRAHETA